MSALVYTLGQFNTHIILEGVTGLKTEQLLTSHMLIWPSIKAHKLMPLGLLHQCFLSILYIVPCECQLLLFLPLKNLPKREKMVIWFLSVELCVIQPTAIDLCLGSIPTF